MEKKFGEQYLKWSEGIPAFIPSFSNYKKSEINFSIKSILRREYAGVLATVIGFAYIDVLRFFIKTEKLGISPLILNILIGTILVVSLLRSLKHYTNILNEKNTRPLLHPGGLPAPPYCLSGIVCTIVL